MKNLLITSALSLMLAIAFGQSANTKASSTNGKPVPAVQTTTPATRPSPQTAPANKPAAQVKAAPSTRPQPLKPQVKPATAPMDK